MNSGGTKSIANEVSGREADGSERERTMVDPPTSHADRDPLDHADEPC